MNLPYWIQCTPMIEIDCTRKDFISIHNTGLFMTMDTPDSVPQMWELESFKMDGKRVLVTGRLFDATVN